jgi:hypothetical protein
MANTPPDAATSKNVVALVVLFPKEVVGVLKNLKLSEPEMYLAVQ